MKKGTLSADEWDAWRGFRRMAEIVSGRVAREITRATGLSSADFVVLMELGKAEAGRRRQRDLLTYLEWDKTRLSHQLTRMASRDLIERESGVDDSVTIRMTETGRRQWAAARPVHADSVRANFHDHLSEKDLATIRTVMDKLHMALLDAER